MDDDIGLFFSIRSDEIHPEIEALIKYNVITQTEAETYVKHDSENLDDFEYQPDPSIRDCKGNELYAGFEGAVAYNWIRQLRVFPMAFPQEAIDALGSKADSESCCRIS